MIRNVLYLIVFCSGMMPAIAYFGEEKKVLWWYVVLLLILCLILAKSWHNLRSRQPFTYKNSDISRIAAMAIAVQFVDVLLIDSIFEPKGLGMLSNNPTAFSMNLCILLSLAIAYMEQIYTKGTKGGRAIVFILLAMTVTMLVWANSRTAMLCMVLLLLFLALKRIQLCRWEKVLIVLTLFTLMLFITVVFVKHDSSKGRAFILQNSIELIQGHPISGYGPDGFLRHYMAKQGEYFRLNPDSQYSLLADEVHHPLNEFIFVWINYGVAGLLFMISVFAFPLYFFMKRTNWTGINVLTTLFVWSLFSYPFSYPIPFITLVLLNLAALHWAFKTEINMLVQRKRKTFSLTTMAVSTLLLGILTVRFHDDYTINRIATLSERGYGKQVLTTYKTLHEKHRTNPYFLYQYMYCQYRLGNFHEATEIYDELKIYCSSYDTELLSADTYFHLKDYDMAIEHYNTASNMIPARFAPLEGMMYSYLDAGRNYEADSVAHIILSKPVKVPSLTVDQIKEEARKVRNDLSQ